MSYNEMTTEELKQLREKLLAAYEEKKGLGLNLSMARGKPAKEQLDLSMPMLSIVNENTPMVGEDGMDFRNYGILSGIKEAKKLVDAHADTKLFVVGEYGRRFFEQHKIPIEHSFLYTAQNRSRPRDQLLFIGSVPLRGAEKNLCSIHRYAQRHGDECAFYPSAAVSPHLLCDPGIRKEDRSAV